MHPNSFQILSLFLITSFLVHINVCYCQDEQYVKCGHLFNCSSLDYIGYPFYGEGRSENCGFPGFELKCENGVPLITIKSVKYRVLEAHYNRKALMVARDDLWSDLCPTSLYNTKLDFNIFNYGTNYQNITLYYGCSMIPGQPLLLPNQFNCNVNRSTSLSFYLTSESLSINYASRVICNNSINVPVSMETYSSLESLNFTESKLRSALAGGFGLEWLADNENCGRCVESGGRCGHNSSLSSFVCYCEDQSYSYTCNESKTRLTQATIIIIAASIGMSTIVILCIFVFYCLRGRWFMLSSNQGTNDRNVEKYMKTWGSFAPKQYSYAEIKKITNSMKEKLGQGGYGRVYKGKLPDGRFVAVKILNETKGNGEDFINEVSSISKTSHVNVVTLLGFCYIKRRALIYEFMPNGSLDKFIYKHAMPNDECHLEWKTLYEITIGIARGLEYLHRGLSTRIIHLDIKPHNILLDEGFCPKISDFGLAKLSEKKESILSAFTARGTPGYIAPEVIFRHLGGVSHKSDVYSYGMMILEMVGARKNVAEVVRSSEIYFPQWIYEHLELGTEINIQAITCEEEEEISRKMILVGLWCIQTNPSDRPAISKVVEMLEGSLHSLRIPPKPFLYSPHPSSEFLLYG